MTPPWEPAIRNAFMAASSFQAVIVQKVFPWLRNSLPPRNPSERSACLADIKDCKTNCGT